MKRHVHHVHVFFLLAGNDIIPPESRPLSFVYLHTRARSIWKQIVDRIRYKKSKYCKEYSIVDKVGSEQLSASPVWCRINRLLISYLISKQARRNF